jgi:3-phenylpropionate/trans-cinnamate dioxygenase ferredoxin reductase component
MHDDTAVIVGAGMAGARAAITLRTEGFDGRLVLVGDEPDPPYERPPLSKGVLRGEQTLEDIAITPKGAGWSEADVELRLGTTVADVDIPARTVTTGDGEHLAFDRLLLATGSEPRRPDLPGIELDGVHVLRTVRDAEAIGTAIERGGPVVVIGGGWIGAEVAACARQRGASVSLVTGGSALLERLLGAEVSAVYAQLHRRHGVDLRERATAVAIDGSRGRVTAVRLADGSRLAASAVVLGVGASPRVRLAERAGLVVDVGVRVDPSFRTSAPTVWATGDIAVMRHPVLDRDVRLDHWAAAWFGGPAAARSMLGRGRPYERIPYLYSDQYDLAMEAWGVPPRWDRVVMRGEPASGSFVAYWLLDGRVVGAMLGGPGEPEERKALEAMVRSAVRVEPAILADPVLPIGSLGQGAAGP